jgi:hypothetical protein
MRQTKNKNVCEKSSFTRRTERKYLAGKFLLFQDNNFAMCLETFFQDVKPA